MNTSSELPSSSTGDRDGDIAKPSSNGSQRDVMPLVLLFITVTISCILVYNSSNNPLMVLSPWKINWFSQNQTSFKTREPASELERVLMNAAMEDKTVIITALNEAWVAPNSMFDLFLESFHIGIGTEKYLKHVIGVCVDNKAYERCLHLHPHCYLINATDYDQLSGPNNYMTPGYLKLVWRRMEFLREVLALGCRYLVVSRSISSILSRRRFSDRVRPLQGKLLKWRFRGRGKHDQEVFNLIKRDPFVDQIGIKMRFLDTLHIGTFCEPSKDVNVVNTMHADCCKGLNNKVSYLNAVLRDWKQYLSESFLGNTKKAEARWRRRHRCGLRVR
ncbi:unnamed protein product [Brassica rapa subsp. trilocularis]|uniref:(rape) hypothetical protein n=1 Tax=Brassica napus TaxID=3708 RepID=A0A816NWJ0_BRANA|nr:unnamed protein product [Brassica napus]